tara:strand:+ start:979 stop:1179 length:201 start_codon:yes stop_codon:yes gene_type:complete
MPVAPIVKKQKVLNTRKGPKRQPEAFSYHIILIIWIICQPLLSKSFFKKIRQKRHSIITLVENLAQ